MNIDRVARSTRIALASLVFPMALAISSPALAITKSAPTYTERYTFTLPYTLSSAVTVNTYVPYDDGTGGGEGVTSGDSYRSNGPGAVTLTDPFLKENNIVSTYFMGTSALGTDSPNHLVIAVNSDFASTAVGNSFANVFGSSFSEDQVVGALEGLYNPGSDDDARNSAYNTIFGFSNTVFADAAGFSPNGGTFTLLGFSDGQIVGSGAASLISSAPEPTNWAMMIIGFGAAGGALRHRRRLLTIGLQRSIA